MSREPDLFNDILVLHLRPWKVQFSDQKFRELLHGITKEKYQFQPLYEVAFIKPVSEKRKYYHALITNEATVFLNTINHEIKSAINDQERKYWVVSALDKKLKQKFTEVRKLIEKRGYLLSNISITNDDAYIIQFLKYQLVRLYLEIQDTYKNFISSESLEPEEIFSNFFSDPASDKTVIVEATKENVPDHESLIVLQPPSEKFIAQNCEIRTEEEGVLSYDDIVEKPASLGRIESILFEVKCIDKNFVLIEDKGNIKKLAAVSRIMYLNNFFKKVTFKQKKINITDLLIRRFLNHRYKTDIDQEFRRFRKDDELKKYVAENLWLNDLPTY